MKIESYLPERIKSLPWIGPIAYFVALLAVYFKSFSLLLTPLAACMGLYVSWVWQVRGLLASLIFIIVAFSYEFQNIPSGELLWHFGLAISFILSLMITSMASLEVSEKNQLTDKLDIAETTQLSHYQKIIQSLQSHVRSVESQCHEISKEYEKASERLRLFEAELVPVEKLSKSASDIENDLLQLKEQLGNRDLMIKELSGNFESSLSELQNLRDLKKALEAELLADRQKLENLQDQHKHGLADQASLDKLHSETIALSKEKGFLEQKLWNLQIAYDQIEQRLKDQKAEYEASEQKHTAALKISVSQLEKENVELQNRLSISEQMTVQLKQNLQVKEVELANLSPQNLAEIDELSRKLHESELIITGLKQNLHAKEDELAAIHSQTVSHHDTLSKKLQESELTIAELKQNLHAKEDELAAIHSQTVSHHDTLSKKLQESELTFAALKQNLQAKEDELAAIHSQTVSQHGTLSKKLQESELTIAALKQNLQAKEDELAAIHSQTVSQQNTLSKKLQESELAIAALKQNLQAKEEELAANHSKTVSQHGTLSKKLQESELTIAALKQNLRAKEDELATIHSQTVSQQNTLSKKLQESELAIAELKQNLQAKEEELATLNSQKHHNAELQKNEHPNNADDLDRELRVTAGRFNQLKEQFSAKGLLLDETRKELFRTQEKLQMLEREFEENQLYDDSWNCQLSNYFSQCEKEHIQTCNNYQHEIDQLQSMISQLLKEAE